MTEENVVYGGTHIADDNPEEDYYEEEQMDFDDEEKALISKKEHRDSMLKDRVILNPKNVKAKEIAARYKVILVGNSGSGKTSLLLRFADNIFNEHVTCTLNVD